MHIEMRGNYGVGITTEAERFMEVLGWRHDIPGLFVKGNQKTNDVEGTLREAGYVYWRGILCKCVPLTADEKGEA